MTIGATAGEQQTLRHAFAIMGIGLHTGRNARVVVHPAPANAGRMFRLAGGVEIPARADFVTDTTRCTTLGRDGATISTVEHLLSALAGLQIDNAVIETDGPEIPILDGSAQPWVEAIDAAGVEKQNYSPRTLTLSAPVIVEEGKSRIEAAPADAFRVRVVTTFEEFNWPEGAAEIECAPGFDAPAYRETIAPARTFAFRREVEMLLAAGLALGGSLDNALIVTPGEGFSSPLRVPLEWCAHKLLDVVGDLALADARLKIQVTGWRPGHRLNARLAGALLRQGTIEEGRPIEAGKRN